MRLCITGCVGFVGYWVVSLCLDAGIEVDGIDDLTPTYNLALKEWRLHQLAGRAGFRFHRLNILDRPALERFAAASASPALGAGKVPFSGVIHLAAASNVRKSIENPISTYETNVLGTLSMLELCAQRSVKKFVLASSASVYGGRPLTESEAEMEPIEQRPSRENDPTDGMLSPYATSKKAAEDLCRLHQRMHGINTVVVRYFAPYGPAGRPDMSIFRFVRWMAEGEPVRVCGKGEQLRDFSFIGDLAQGTLAALNVKGFEVINLGGGNPVSIHHVLDRLEKHLGTTSRRISVPPPPADIQANWADITKARTLLDWFPRTSLDEGLRQTVDWYVSHREWLRKLPLD
ncbi:MAG: NAD-dependent epimerase/dehydratase family protein [Candidatus Bipolaricaulota bacterium]